MCIYSKQDRKYTYNVTLSRVRAFIVTVEKQYECVFVVLDVQHEMRMRHIAIFGLSVSTEFFHLIS
jgi:hypothetical protein